jgi:microsomal dipeptidase-like Zn-dependent dipeptidase
VKGTCDGPRNLGDDHIRRIAAGGGVIGIGYWDAAVCDVSVNGIVTAIRYVRDLVGIEYVGLGSDFDGGTETPFDTSGLDQITAGLLDAGFAEGDIRNIMGGNVLRLMRTHSVGDGDRLSGDRWRHPGRGDRSLITDHRSRTPSTPGL